MSRCLNAVRLGALLSVACMLAACGSPIREPALAADLPETWHNAPPISPELTVREPDLEHWWQVLGDRELDEWVSRALQGNLGIAAASARLQAARSLAHAANAASAPVLRFETSALPSPDSRRSYFIAGFDAQWEAGLFGRTAAQYDEARADAQAAAADLKAARVAVAAELVRTWLEWRHAECRHSLMAEGIAVQERRLSLWQSRVAAQQASLDDLARSNRDLQQARLEAWDVSLSESTSRAQLALLVGDQGTPVPPKLSCLRSALHGIRISQLPADLLRTRPEIQRAQQRVIKAFSTAREAWANQYPRLSLGGTLSLAVPLSGSGSTVHSILAAAPSVDIPLFDAGARRAVSQARDSEMQAAVLEYRQSVLEGITEVESAMAALNAQHEREDRLSQASLEAARMVSYATHRQRLRQSDGFDAADAQDAWIKARVATLDAELAHQLAFIRLYKALGGANPADGEFSAQAVRDLH